MIVDDEVLAINYLKKLINWEKYGFEIIAEATDGKKALEIYKKYKPAVVIVDIKMPVMDGLELSYELTRNDNPPEIILLTAYANFQYAKQAIEYGISNYLLKHELDEDTIITELTKIKSKLEKGNKTQKMIRHQLVKKALEGRLTNHELKEMDSNVRSVNKSIVVLVFKIKAPFIINHHFDSNYYTEDSLSLKEILDIQSSISSENLDYIETVEMDKKLCVSLLSIQNLKSEMAIQQILNTTLRNIQDNFKDKYKQDICICVNINCGGVEILQDTFRRACNAIRYSVFVEQEEIIWANNIPIAIPDKAINMEEELEGISEQMKNLNIEGLEKGIKQIFANLKEPYWNVTSLRDICRKLILLLEYYKEQNNIEVTFNETDDDLFYTVKDIERFFISKFKEYINESKYLGVQTYSRDIQKIIGYITKNYDKDLNLKDIGDLVGMSGIYVGQIFKKETGDTFLTFLTNHRIKIAKKLLASGKYNVSEVAERVGYKTSQYFSGVFYRSTGITPHNYRKWGGKDGKKYQI